MRRRPRRKREAANPGGAPPAPAAVRFPRNKTINNPPAVSGHQPVGGFNSSLNVTSHR